MTEQQKRVIRENPHLISSKLASIMLGVSPDAIKKYRQRNGLASNQNYKGIGNHGR